MTITKHLKLMLTISLLSITLVACGGSDDPAPAKKASTTWGNMTWGTDCWKDPCQ